jgi:hypothetical protein
VAEIGIECQNLRAFQSFINYLYKDKPLEDFFEEDRMDLCQLATKYEVKRLEEICRQVDEKFLVISPSTFEKDFATLLNPPIPFADVIFEVGGTHLPAHRVFLASSSEYFHRMFSVGLKETHEEVIPLSVSEAVFRAVREYCYRGDVEITGEIAVDLLAAATQFSLPRLKHIVASVMAYSLDVDNACCLYDVGRLYGALLLERSALSLILHRFAKIKNTSGWKDLSEEHKKEILGKGKEWGLKLDS